jgi:thiamine-phosphate diphosphorylase
MAFAFPSPLYVIVDADAAGRAGWTAPTCAAACLDAGARLLQVRAKDAPARDMLTWVEDLLRLAESYPDTLVFVNDRVDVAIAAGLPNVHVGQDDLPADDVRQMIGDVGHIGLSTHTRAQVEAARGAPVDYLAMGPVFGTDTKDTGYEAVGLGRVRMAVDVVQAAGLPWPVVGIGGITIERAPQVIEAGAAAVAVISAIFEGDGPAPQVRRFLRALR